jgi:hypothetical protein
VPRLLSCCRVSNGIHGTLARVALTYVPLLDTVLACLQLLLGIITGRRTVEYLGHMLPGFALIIRIYIVPRFSCAMVVHLQCEMGAAHVPHGSQSDSHVSTSLSSSTEGES